MDQFLRGVTAAGCLTIGLFFLRFFQRDRDRLFMFFSLSFFLLAADRIALAVASAGGITTAIPYWARAFAYLLITLAILDKNISRANSARS
jgi:hypothetical protein